MNAGNPRAAIGDNGPPEPTPFETAREAVADLETEAQNWFDGDGVETQQQADAVAKLLDMAREAKKAAKAGHDTEKRPHLEAGKAVDDKWRGTIADFDRIAEIASSALTPWLKARKAEKDAREASAREAADRAAAEARRLAQQASDTLGAAKARDAAIEAAEQAARDLASVERERVTAKGGKRAASLHTSWKGELQDRVAYLNHLKKTRPDELEAMLAEHAATAVRHGARELPGVRIWSVQVAV